MYHISFINLTREKAAIGSKAIIVSVTNFFLLKFLFKKCKNNFTNHYYCTLTNIFSVDFLSYSDCFGRDHRFVGTSFVLLFWNLFSHFGCQFGHNLSYLVSLQLCKLRSNYFSLKLKLFLINLIINLIKIATLTNFSSKILWILPNTRLKLRSSW